MCVVISAYGVDRERRQRRVALGTGADAAQFVNTVKEYLENPDLLLLE